MLRISITLILIVQVTITFSQVINIVDESDLQPIERVMIFNQNQDKYVVSDANGSVDLSIFKKKDTLYFQHASFKIHIVLKSELPPNKQVLLSESMVSLSEVIIAANKWEQERSEISNKITIIKPKEVEFSNPQTTADILQGTGEVYVQKSQLGGGSPMIRGFATNTVLIMVDGVRLNNAIYRQGNMQNVINLDAHIMDGSEVLFGPGSVIYGSDALGGVMDFRTRKPLFSTNDKLLLKVNALTRYSSANNENTGHVDVILAKNRFSSVSSISFSKYDDLKMGSIGNNNSNYLSEQYVQRINGIDSVFSNSNKNIQKYSGFSQINLMQKFKYKLTNKLDIEYAAHISQSSQIPRYDALRQMSNEEPKYAEWSYGPQIWQMHNLTLLIHKKSKYFDELKIINALQNYKESRITRKLNNSNRFSQYENVNVFSSNIDLNKDVNKNTLIYYGFEFLFNGLNSTAETEDINTGLFSQDWTMPRYPDGENKFYSGAFYAGSKLRVDSSLVLNMGIRYSYVQIQSTFNNKYYTDFGFSESFTNKNGAVNGSFGAAYKATENLQINANLSSGFQAPNWDGLGKTFAPKKGVVVVPNQGLKPQYAYNAELGMLYYFFNNMASFELTGFYTLINDPIVQSAFSINGQDSLLYDDEMNAIEAFVNVDNAHVYGLNAALNANLTKSVGIKSYFTYTYGEDNTGDRLRHVAPMFGSTHLIFKTIKFKSDLYVVYNAPVNELPSSEHDKDYMYASRSNGELFAPAWYTINLKLGYQLVKKLQINAGIENVLDARYRPYASGIVSPGRNFIVALRFKV